MLLFMLSCTKSEMKTVKISTPHSSLFGHNQQALKETDTTLREFSTIRFKTNFICNPPSDKRSSHKEIYAYIDDSRLFLQSKSKHLLKATDLYYGDDFDMESYSIYPAYQAYKDQGMSYIIIPITIALGCIDRAELSLTIANH